MKRENIFQNLLLKIITPVIFVIIGLAYYNIEESTKEIQNSYDVVNKLFADEIHTFLEFQDKSLSIIESNLDQDIKAYSYQLINQTFNNTDSIESYDLKKLLSSYRIPQTEIDIYIIDKKGRIVNTTYQKDAGKNINDFDENTRDLISRVFMNKSYEKGEFVPEHATNILRKYTYHCTLDGKYIIELGVKSIKANQVIEQVEFKLNHLTQRANTAILQIDLFIGNTNKPLSFNNKAAKVPLEHLNTYHQILSNRLDVTTIDGNSNGYTNSKETEAIQDNRTLHYQYIYMPRDSRIYKNSVVRIISDRSKVDHFIQTKILLYVIVTIILIISLIIFLLLASKSISNPLTKIIDGIKGVEAGNYNEALTLSGVRELETIKNTFNAMTSTLQKRFTRLEVDKDALKSKLEEAIAIENSLKIQSDLQRDEILKLKNKLELAFKKVDDQNKRLANNTYYAQRVENILLPSKQILNKLLNKHFVYYQPKNIVGGDFYWATEIEGKTLIVCADCTGSGVSGAFMSVLGISMLNEIIKQRRITKIEVILENLRRQLTEALISSELNIVRDGIDISVISIDKIKSKIQYVGANSQIIHFHEGKQEVKKGNKHPLAGFDEELENYQIQEFEYQIGDMVYMYTDGYQNQFGGEQDKKFMGKRLKNLLTRIHNLPVEEQEQLTKHTIEDWMKTAKQTDDILIMGIKL